jgi:hypothetical protein
MTALSVGKSTLKNSWSASVKFAFPSASFTRKSPTFTPGRVTTEIAKAHPESEFEKYRIIQDRLFESDFDRLMKQLEHKNDKNNED